MLSRGREIDISWDNGSLRQACSTDREGQRRWGIPVWAVLKRRLATLAAAPTLEDMAQLPGRCHALTGPRSGQFALHLSGSLRLVFEVNHDPTPMLPSGGIDRRAVTSILVIEVVDYHGD